MHLLHEKIKRELTMRRKKDNKRVLRAGNGSSSRNSRNRFRSKGNRFKSNRGPNSSPRTKQKKKGKRNGKLVLLMIIALIAFIIGAGVGISLSFDDGSADENATHIENVTDEMVNSDNSDTVTFNSSDSVDYNENQSSNVLGHSKNSK